MTYTPAADGRRGRLREELRAEQADPGRLARARSAARTSTASPKVVFQGSGVEGATTRSRPSKSAQRRRAGGRRCRSTPRPARSRRSPPAASQSDPTKAVRILPPPPPESQPSCRPRPARATGAPSLETATSAAKWFLGSQRGVVFSYRLGGSTPGRRRRQPDPPVRRHGRPDLEPAAGRARRGAHRPLDRHRRPARCSPRAATRSAPWSAAASRDRHQRRRRRRRARRLRLLRPLLPCPRQATTTATPGARFGAGRSGHTHQGQDVMAAVRHQARRRPGRHGQVLGLPVGGRLLHRDPRRRRHRQRLHAPGRQPTPFERGRQGLHRPADRRGRRHRRRDRLPPALRDLDRARAGTTAATRSTRCRCCRPGTASAERRSHCLGAHQRFRGRPRRSCCAPDSASVRSSSARKPCAARGDAVLAAERQAPHVRAAEQHGVARRARAP